MAQPLQKQQQQQQQQQQTFHAAWTLLQSSRTRASDYDARMVGAAKLQSTVAPVYARIDAVVSQILGGSSQESSDRMRLSNYRD